MPLMCLRYSLQCLRVKNVAGAADNRASDNVSPSDLLSTRRGLTAWVRRRATHVKTAVAEKDSQAIHGHITALKDAFMKLSVIHNQLIESAGDESIIETYENFYDKYESIYIDTLTLGSEFKSKSEHHAKDENNSQLIEIFKQLSIPKLELEKFRLVGWLVVFKVPSTARSFRDGTPIYCPLRRT